MKTTKTIFTGKDLDDLRAVEAIKAGDRNAFAVIFKRYKPILMSRFTMRLNWDRTMAEDLVMEALEKVYQKIHLYEKDFTLNSWITRLADNYLIDWFRKKKVETVSMDAVFSSGREDVDETMTMQIPDVEMNVEEKIIMEERNEMVRKAIDAMDEKSKLLLQMRYFEMMTYEEIAAETGNKINTMKGQLLRAKAKLDLYLPAAVL